MKLHNHTDLPARLFRGEPYPDHMLATVVVKLARPIHADGELGPPLAGAPGPSEAATATEHGLLPGDAVPYRGGSEFWLLGHARPPAPTAAMTVALFVGNRERRTLLVVGDRSWHRDGTPSAPAEFEAMPLTHARAFGGEALAGGLPNIEWPDDRVQTPACRPDPAGFAPLVPGSAQHLQHAVAPDPTAGAGIRISRRWWSATHPRLVLPAQPAGTSVRVVGVAGEHALHFALPASPARLTVVLGGRRHALALLLDTIGILADAKQVSLSYRASFRYAVVPGMARAVHLEAA